MQTVTMRELWKLQDKLMRYVEPGTKLDDVLDTMTICLRCEGVQREGKECRCDEQTND